MSRTTLAVLLWAALLGYVLASDAPGWIAILLAWAGLFVLALVLMGPRK